MHVAGRRTRPPSSRWCARRTRQQPRLVFGHLELALASAEPSWLAVDLPFAVACPAPSPSPYRMRSNVNPAPFVVDQSVSGSLVASLRLPPQAEEHPKPVILCWRLETSIVTSEGCAAPPPQVPEPPSTPTVGTWPASAGEVPPSDPSPPDPPGLPPDADAPPRIRRSRTSRRRRGRRPDPACRRHPERRPDPANRPTYQRLRERCSRPDPPSHRRLPSKRPHCSSSLRLRSRLPRRYSWRVSRSSTTRPAQQDPGRCTRTP